MKKHRISYCAGMGLSLLVGLWHFLVPWMFRWYSYIPGQYANLIVGIDWTNLCFSLLLSGMSLLLPIWNKKVFAGNGEALVLYGFMAVVWVFRVALAIVEPWPLEPVAWAAYAQFAGAAAIMLLLLVPLVKLAGMRQKSGKPRSSAE